MRNNYNTIAMAEQGSTSSSSHQKNYKYDALPPSNNEENSGMELVEAAGSATEIHNSHSYYYSSSWKLPVISTLAWLAVVALFFGFVLLPRTTNTNSSTNLSAFLWGDRVQPLGISLWLIPPDDISKEMKPFIDEFSALMQPEASAPYRPHITITWAGVAQTEQELLAKANSIQDALQKDTLLAQQGVDCHFETYPQTTTDHDHVVWSQAFILKMNISTTFERICQTSRRALKLDDDDVLKNCHNPHMSLVYSNDYPTSQVHDIAYQEIDLPLQFTATRVALYAIDPVSVEGVKDWVPVSEFRLGGSGES